MFELPDDDDNFWEDLPLDDITNSKSPNQKTSNPNVPQQCQIQSSGTSRTINCNENQEPSSRNKSESLGNSHSLGFNNRGGLLASSGGENTVQKTCISNAENSPRATFKFKPVTSPNRDSLSVDELKVHGTEKKEPRTGKRLSSESIPDSSKKIRLHKGTGVDQFVQNKEKRSDYQSPPHRNTQLETSTTESCSLRITQLETFTTQTSNLVGQGGSDRINQNLKTTHPQVVAFDREPSSGVTRNKNTTPVIKKAKRKFPGPAGLLPKLSGNSEKIKEAVTLSLKDSQDKITVEKEDTILSSQSTDDIFSEDPWRTLMEELGADGQQLLHNFSIVTNLTKARKKQLHRGKVPLLMCVIDNIDWHGSDLSVLLKDRSGEVQGTVHRDIMKEYESELQVGSALVLRQVSVISPNPRSHYLNITPANIVFIYSKNGDSCQLVNTRNSSLSSVLEEVQRQESSQRYQMNQSATAKTPSRNFAHSHQFQNRTPQLAGRPSTPGISQMYNGTSFGGRPSTPCNPQLYNRAPQFAGRPATPSTPQMHKSTPRFGGRAAVSDARTPSTGYSGGNLLTGAQFKSQSIRIPPPAVQQAGGRTPVNQTANRNIQAASCVPVRSSTSVPSTSSNLRFQGIHPQNQSGDEPFSNSTKVTEKSTVVCNENQETSNQTANVSSVSCGIHLEGFSNNKQELNNNQQSTPNRRSFKFKPSKTSDVQSLTNNNSSSASTRTSNVFTPSLCTSANQNLNNSAPLLQQGGKPKFEVDSVWGEDLSDDLLSQLSEEF